MNTRPKHPGSSRSSSSSPSPEVVLIAFKCIREPIRKDCNGFAELAASNILLAAKCIDNPAYIVAPVVTLRHIYRHRNKPFCLYNDQLYEMHLSVGLLGTNYGCIVREGVSYYLVRSGYKFAKQCITEYMSSLAQLMAT